MFNFKNSLRDSPRSSKGVTIIFQFHKLFAVFASFTFLPLFTFGQSGKTTSETYLTSLEFSKPLVEVWRYEDKRIFNKSTASDNKEAFVAYPLKESENFFVSSYKEGILSFAGYSENGLVWSSDLGGEIVSAPATDDQSIYIVVKNREDLILKNLNKATGIARWQIKLNLTIDEIDLRSIEKIYLQIFFDKLFVISNGGSFFAIEKERGGIVWNLSRAEKLTSAPFFTQDNLIVGAFGNQIIEIRAADGAVERQFKAEKAITVLNGTEDGKLILGGGNGMIYSLNPADGLKLWSNQYGAEVTNIVLTRLGLLVVSADNFIRLISLSGGKRIWKRSVSGRLSAKPLVSGNFGVFATFARPEADILDLKNGKIINKISLSEESSFIDGIFLSDELLIFSTADGLIGFSDNRLIKKTKKRD